MSLFKDGPLLKAGAGGANSREELAAKLISPDEIPTKARIPDAMSLAVLEYMAMDDMPASARQTILQFLAPEILSTKAQAVETKMRETYEKLLASSAVTASFALEQLYVIWRYQIHSVSEQGESRHEFVNALRPLEFREKKAAQDFEKVIEK